MSKKIAFVILHYKNLKDTIECIESIQKLEEEQESAIIVVDNHSLQEKEVKELKKYTQDLILLEENTGFAKGNNIGCKYAIEKYQPLFLCVINNDIVIHQKDFIKEIEKCYKETSFDMMGPKILTDGGESVNPFPVYKTLEEVETKIHYHEKLIKIYRNILLRNLLKVYIKTKSLFLKPLHRENGLESAYDVALHGCAIIFSKKYYKKYKDVFYNETFLYHEEEFLNYRKEQDHLITYYDANLELFHKEGSSLNENFKKENVQKLIFRNKEILKSLNLLKEVMSENKKV